MKLKEKILLSSFLLLLSSVINLWFSASLHNLMTKKQSTLTWIPLWNCLVGLITQKQQLLLFLSFEGMIVLCCFLFWIQNDKGYQSRLMKITEDIYTPEPVGQYQHGSARWLKEKEKGQVFAYQTIDPNHKVIQELLKTGYDDLDFCKQKEVEEKIEEEQEIRQSGEKLNSALPVSIKKDNREEGEVTTQDDSFEFVEFDVKKELMQIKEEKEQEADQKEAENEEGIEKKEQEKKVIDPYKIFDSGGIVIGREKIGTKEKIYYIDSDTHTLTIGATRSGKSRCLVIQSICSLALAGESMVISDPKAELFHYTSEYLKKLGYDVICLDFKNPEKSSRYNLLQPVIDALKENDKERAEMYAWDITNILVGDNSSNEKIWENGEKATIAAAILCVVFDNMNHPQYQNLTNVYWFIAKMSKAIGNKIPMVEYMKERPSDHPARALLSIAEVAPSKTKGSFDTSALTTLRLFVSQSMYAITHQTDYNLSDIGKKKQALFFILPDEKTTYYPIASLIVSQLYELLVRQSDLRGGRLKNRVNFVLDEFGNFTKINDFTNKLTVGGGRGIRFHLFLQSFEQLTQKYNKETAAIVKSNCQTWIYLQADDKETLQEICDKLGKYTTSAYQLSSQHGKYTNPSSSHSMSLMSRELLTTDEIRRIKRPNQIVIGRSYPALMTAPDLSCWYFNQMCGLGNEEHNRKVREEREKKRPILLDKTEPILLWNIWVYYRKELEQKIAKKQGSDGIAEQMNSIFSRMKRQKGE